jgi:protein involved in polysaccharide export with SLBB domain
VPIVTSVSAFLAEQTQTITITGSGFGTQPAFSGTSYYMGIWDVTGGNWSAGYGEDGVTVTVSSWTDNQIVITGFGGGYGSGWQYTNLDSLTLKIWNPGTSRDNSSSQQDASQSTCTITAGGGVTNCASSTTAPGVPTITWPTPAPITQDTPLGAAQLDATTTVAGTFVYTPGPGAVLTAGSQTLSVVFTPIDTVHWTTATATVTLVVNSPTAGLTAQYSGSPVAIQSINLGSTSPSLISLPFTMGSAGTLGSTLMVTQGATGLDFTDAGTGTCAPGTTYSQGDSCTVVVHFAPAYPGPRYGAAELFDSSGNPIATVYLQGTGVAPLANFPSGTQSTLTTSTLHSPQALAADGNGNVYIADTINGRILKETLAAGGYTESSVLAPGGYVVSYGIAVDGAGSVYVSDTFNGRVLKETPVAGGGYAESVVPTSTLSYPYGVAVDGSGNVYIADNGNNRVLMETLSAGTYTESTIGSGLNGPGGLAVDGAGTVYITDGGNFRVLKETPSSGAYVQRVLTNEGLSGDDEIEPTGVAVDGIGDVYISDQRYGVILKESPVLENGAYEASQIPGSGLNQPGGVAIDGSGNLYIADSLNNRVVVENLAEPPSVTFPTPTVARTTDSADDPEVVTLVNIGNASLTVSNVNSPSTFPAQSGFSCAAVPTTIGVGGLCYLRLSFAPQTSGSQSGTVTITDNSLNAPAPGYATQSIPVSGTATPNPLTITSVSAILPQQSQTITISGMGFGSHAAYTGDSNYIALVDTTAAGWNAGHSGSAITLAVSSWTDSQIVLSGFSGSYGTNGWCISPGDQLSVKVWNAQTGSGPAIYPIVASGGTNTCTLAINSVSPILPQQTQTITISGAGFGTQAAYTGDSNYIALVDTTAAGWNAGHSGSAVTLAVSSWTDSQIVLSGFSGSYGTNGWCISPGDQLSVRVWNAKTGAGPAIYPITASSGTNTCTLAISSVSAILPQQTQTITINGSDFGSQSAYTGDSNSIELVDSTGVVWDAGHSGAAVPLVVSSWTDSQIVLSGFGSGYGTHGWCISPGDQLTVKVWNAQTGYGPAIYPITVSSGTNTCTVAITSVSAILPQQTQTITISGTGFGSQSAYTGDSNSIELVDSTGTGWNAGHSGSAVTLAVSSWTDSQIVLSGFSGGYATHGWCVKPGDQLAVKVWNAQTGYGPAVYPITASSGTNTCP